MACQTSTKKKKIIRKTNRKQNTLSIVREHAQTHTLANRIRTHKKCPWRVCVCVCWPWMRLRVLVQLCPHIRPNANNYEYNDYVLLWMSFAYHFIIIICWWDCVCGTSVFYQFVAPKVAVFQSIDYTFFYSKMQPNLTEFWQDYICHASHKQRIRTNIRNKLRIITITVVIIITVCCVLCVL